LLVINPPLVDKVRKKAAIGVQVREERCIQRLAAAESQRADRFPSLWSAPKHGEGG
jgi:hypothetical protein